MNTLEQPTLEYRIQQFALLLELEQRERYASECDHTGATLKMLQDNSCTVRVKPAAKYTKIMIHTANCFMIVNETGEIFGTKGYGVIHRGHPYGTLDTVDEWYWGDYTPRRKQ